MATKISDAFKSHPVQVPVHKTLDFDSLQELPDSYAWIQPEVFPSSNSLHEPAASNIITIPTSQESIPLIDISLPNAPHLLSNALRTWGAAQVINHAVPISLLDSVESTADALFSLPSSQKLKASRAPDGMTGYGLVRISTFFPKHMWSEGFTIVGSPLHHFRQLWPDDHTKRCGVFEEYEREMKSLSKRITWAVLGELGISREDIKWAEANGDLTRSDGVIQMNSYPVCPNPDRAMGLGVHTDTSLITILYQNNVRGLQVLREANQWVTVEPVAGGLVVLVGDLLHILTNGLYPSALHQAVVNRTRRRMSVAYISGPPETAEISPVQKLLGPTQPPLYRTVTWTEYLGKKAQHFNHALSSVRLSANDHNQVN